jgi:hypothetical protein
MAIKKITGLDLTNALNAVRSPMGNPTRNEMVDFVQSLYMKVNSNQIQPLSLQRTLQIMRQIAEINRSSGQNFKSPVNETLRAIGVILFERAMNQLKIGNAELPSFLHNILLL